MFNSPPPANRWAFLKVATYVEASLVLAAYFFGWLADLDPLADLRLELPSLLWGVAGTAPLYLLFLLSYRFPLGGLRAIKRLLVEQLGPFLDACHWTHLLYLGMLAGFTEEVLFRGLLQPLAESHGGWAAGIAASNLLFALAHCITPLYALLAGLTGIYLGLALDWGGERNLLTPIAIHALYDFLAFLAVARTYRAGHGRVF